MNKQKIINNFKREYLNPFAKINWNCMKLRSDGERARRITIEICLWLERMNLTYACEVKTNWGTWCDIVVPELNIFIEVRDSEEGKKKVYPKEIRDMIRFVDVSNPFGIM